MQTVWPILNVLADVGLGFLLLSNHQSLQEAGDGRAQVFRIR